MSENTTEKKSIRSGTPFINFEDPLFKPMFKPNLEIARSLEKLQRRVKECERAGGHENAEIYRDDKGKRPYGMNYHTGRGCLNCGIAEVRGERIPVENPHGFRRVKIRKMQLVDPQPVDTLGILAPSYEPVPDGEGFFHDWGICTEDGESFTVALVERPNGAMVEVPVDLVQFIK